MPAKKQTAKVFIVDGLRTPIGSSFRSLKGIPAVNLAAVVIKEALSRNKIKKSAVDEVVLGHAVAAGNGQNPARQAAFLAGLPLTVPAFTISNVCGSGLQSVISGIQAITCQDADLILAGGAESASQCPNIISQDSEEEGTNSSKESLTHDGLLCRLSGKHMGQLADHLAKKFRISRADQDKYVLLSHLKTCRAQAQGKLRPEIVAVKTKGGQLFSRDERPRRNIDPKILAGLPSAFEKKGTVTVGNSSIPADGAGIVVLASAGALKKFRLKPKARVLGYVTVADDPQMVFTAGIKAVKECLKKCGLPLAKIDLFEISEAFACQAILTQKKLKIPDAKMNVFGGDIALGHPLGAAGTRILVTLLNALQDQKKKKGVAVICLGGGGAVAMAIERVS